MTANTSEHTVQKMDAFKTIMEWHIKITDATRGVYFKKHWPFRRNYIYIDLYAGPGFYDNEDYTGPGSPIIAKRVLDSARMPHECVLFNTDEYESDLLKHLFKDDDNVYVHNEDNCHATQYLTCYRNQFGLAYFDPNNVRFDGELAERIADCLPKVDLLFYFGATYDKRVRRSLKNPIGEGHSLMEKMILLFKKSWFVYAPYGQPQYTFMLGTNANAKSWKRVGWYSLDTAVGQSIFNILNYTKEEIESGKADQLGFSF